MLDSLLGETHTQFLKVGVATGGKTMGNKLSPEGSNGASSALTSLWSSSSDKDDTCRTWGLVRMAVTAS